MKPVKDEFQNRDSVFISSIWFRSEQIELIGDWVNVK